MSPRRMFVGKDFEGRATLVLSDAQGQERLVLSVAEQGMPRIEFLDRNGEVVCQIVP